jgi:autotransporter-associated beta strand protein
VYTPTINLDFPAGAARAATQNDLATGTVLNRISVSGQATVAGTATPYSFAQAPDPAVNSVVLGTGSPSSGNFIVQSNAGFVTYALPTTLASNGDQSILVGSSGTTLSITAAVTASALNNLNKDGDGRLVLGVANPNLRGGVKVNAGPCRSRAPCRSGRPGASRRSWPPALACT